MIEGMIQGIKYGESAFRTYFHLRHDGSDVTTVDADSAKVTIYDPSGTAILEDEALTQVGSTAVFYVDIDASDTTVWELDYYYRARVFWEVSSVEYEDHVFLDVVKWPFNEPLVTTEELDDLHPEWKGKKPGAWTDWKIAIELGHLKLAKDLREMRDNKGSPIYPNRILDRGQLRQAEIGYIEREIALRVRLTEKDREMYLDAADRIIPTLLILDRDDDLTKDSDEEAIAGGTLVH